MTAEAHNDGRTATTSTARDLPGTRVIATKVLSFADGHVQASTRCVPIECPIALEYNGIGYAVMMGTPIALEDFAIGFTVSEGLAAASEITDPAIFETGGGFVVRCNLPAASLPRIMERARSRVSESGCGICGIDSIAAALAPLGKVSRPSDVTLEAIDNALRAMQNHQDLGQATGASHAAAWCSPIGAITIVREDVGRHNALDKLIGAMARSKQDPRSGFLVLSARCSQELVEKAVRSGVTLLVTISAPSSLAVSRAVEADLTLLSLARRDTALLINDPYDLFPRAS